MAAPLPGGDFPLGAEVEDFSGAAESHACFYVFHEGLGGESSRGGEGGAAEDHGLVSKGDSTEDDSDFIHGLDEEGGWGGVIKALAGGHHGGAGVEVGGVGDGVTKAWGGGGICVGDEDP